MKELSTVQLAMQSAQLLEQLKNCAERYDHDNAAATCRHLALVHDELAARDRQCA
jgi:hypothetical protein